MIMIALIIFMCSVGLILAAGLIIWALACAAAEREFQTPAWRGDITDVLHDGLMERARNLLGGP